ncbi:MAG: pantoate--beta-alanine ligase [Candidatus Nanopelagicales bacterium]
MRVVEDRRDLLSDTGDARRGVVMTMGALHEGHASLIRAARERDDHVTVTIFVNPLQFSAGEDLDRYPRSLQADLELCESLGVNCVYTPRVSQVYPREPEVTLDPGQLGRELEGAARPDHFRGVLTVVLKLLQATQPDDAFFGEKDYQQLTLLRSMAYDLDLGVNIVGVPTSREADGLARSSRNLYLDDEQRARATAIPRALVAAAQRTDAVEIQQVAARHLAGLDVDYAVVRSADLGPAEVGVGRLLIAARVGTTRLLDNCAVEVRSV